MCPRAQFSGIVHDSLVCHSIGPPPGSPPREYIVDVRRSPAASYPPTRRRRRPRDRDPTVRGPDRMSEPACVRCAARPREAARDPVHSRRAPVVVTHGRRSHMSPSAWARAAERNWIRLCGRRAASAGLAGGLGSAGRCAASAGAIVSPSGRSVDPSCPIHCETTSKEWKVRALTSCVGSCGGQGVPVQCWNGARRLMA